MEKISNLYYRTIGKMDGYFIISRYIGLVLFGWCLMNLDGGNPYNFSEWSAMIFLAICYPFAAYPFRNVLTLSYIMGYQGNYVVILPFFVSLIYLIIKLMITFFVFMLSPLIAPITLLVMYFK